VSLEPLPLSGSLSDAGGLYIRCELVAHNFFTSLETGLKGQRALVTGGSGGIGSAVVRLLAAEGSQVVVHYHSGRERAEAAGGHLITQADLTNEADVERMFSETGELDVCAAVAGVWPADDVPVSELSLARWRETIELNLTATFLTARGFLAQLGDREGSLVLVGSTAGTYGEAGHADYAAAKSAIIGGLLLSLKNEAVRRNPRTRVNAVAPGWTVSPMTARVLDEEKVRRISRTMALRKVATADDIAAQIVALASPLISGHVTGQVITVAGGMEGRVLHED
jgi:3-oxoacyl-[acyl-carrier protein] reductase